MTKKEKQKIERIIEILEADPYVGYTLYGGILRESDEIAQMLKEVLEDNTEGIEGLKYEEANLFDDKGNILETQYILRDEDVINVINELVKAVNKLMKEGKE